jgi:predicted GNAT family N-acyltransferase
MTGKGYEKRQQIRRRVYFGEGVKITLRDVTETVSFNGEALDVSPWGLAFVISDNNNPNYPKQGQEVIVYYSNRDRALGSVKARVMSAVKTHRRGGDYIRYGLEFINEHFLSELGKEEKRYYNLADLFIPHAWCSDPFFFQEKILFRISAFNASGMKLITSARNKSFLPNLILHLKMYLPIQGEFEVLVRVLHTETPTEESLQNRYIVLVEYVNPTQQFLQAMVEYILFCGVDVSPQELRREKLPMSAIEKSLTFYYASIQFDSAVLSHMRETCMFDELGVINSEGYAVQNEAILEHDGSQFDIYDDSSRQIVCKLGKKPIACVRVIYNDKDRKKCELANFVQAIPEWVWARRFVEISRLAWEKEYRESDVFVNLIRHIIRIAVESGHSHIVTSAPRALKQLYLKVGFQVLNLQWKEDVDAKKRFETPMILDAKNILHGDLIIDKFVWNKIYAPVAKHLGILKS